MQLIWLLQKDMYHLLKTNHMHWKLCKSKDILISQFEGFHPEKNSLHKGEERIYLIIRLDNKLVHQKHCSSTEHNEFQRTPNSFFLCGKNNQKKYIFNLARKPDLKLFVPKQFWGLCSRKPITVFRNDISFGKFPNRKDGMLKELELPVTRPTSIYQLGSCLCLYSNCRGRLLERRIESKFGS
jgi:hypothetical protein